MIFFFLVLAFFHTNFLEMNVLHVLLREITFEKNLTDILKVPFLPESLLEILDLYPCLFENPDQGSLF